MLSRKLQDGVVFVGECVNHIFMRGDLHCPCCNGVLRGEIGDSGEANLVCTTKGQGCANPIKSFESEREMYSWRDNIWEVIARTCREQN